MTTSSRFLTLLIAALVAAAACGNADAADGTSTTAPAAGSTTEPPVPETPTTAASTTTEPTSTTEPTAGEASSTTVDTNTLAGGSGCTPGGTELPDGEWFGYVDSADPAVLGFDLACWFGGEAAILASAEDGEESPPPNDYYVRNANPAIRQVPVGEADVVWLPNVGDPTSEETVGYGEWLVFRQGRDPLLQPGVWITIEGGVITLVTEQYVP
jgi:hypothetical protein